MSYDELRYTTPTDEAGGFIEAQLTDEGVIVDKYDADGECIGTFARTYEEFFDG